MAANISRLLSLIDQTYKGEIMDPRVAELKDALEKLRRKIQHQEKDDAREFAKLERVLLKLKPQQRVRSVQGCKGMSENECRETGELMGCRWKKWGRSAEASCGQTRTRRHERERILSSSGTPREAASRQARMRPAATREPPMPTREADMRPNREAAMRQAATREPRMPQPATREPRMPQPAGEPRIPQPATREAAMRQQGGMRPTREAAMGQAPMPTPAVRPVLTPSPNLRAEVDQLEAFMRERSKKEK